MYTEEQIEDFKAKADKWDALDAELSKIYDEEDGTGDIVHVGILASEAFGYL